MISGPTRHGSAKRTDARPDRPDPDRRRNPFPILCGTSAGAINAAGIACLADNFGKATTRLASIWRNMHAGDIYRADPVGIGSSGARWLSMLALGWILNNPPRSLLDNTPLKNLLSRHLDFKGIDRAIATADFLTAGIERSRSKDYEDPFRLAMFGNAAELDAVIGDVKENEFIQEAKMRAISFREKLEGLKNKE